jgi:hypothetical protein
MAAVAIRGTTYPVVLPKLRDPRLHLAATITSLQVLGLTGASDPSSSPISSRESSRFTNRGDPGCSII